MQDCSSSDSTFTLQISTWFQVHRGVDEYCCTLTFRSEQLEASCTDYRTKDIFTRKVVEFALMLIELEAESTDLPTLQIEGYEDVFSPAIESCRVRIAQAREGMARLEFRHRRDLSAPASKMEGVWIGAEEARTINVDVLEEDVRRMGYSLLSSVVEGGVDFSFELHPAARSSGRQGWQPSNDDDIP